MAAKKKGVSRRLKNVNQAVGKKAKARRRLSAAMRLRARRAASNYKKRRNAGDVVFDKIRTKFRRRVKKGYGKPGRPLAAGAPHPLSKKARRLSRKAKTIAALARKKGRSLTRAEKRQVMALGKNVKSIYSGNRKRMFSRSKERSREIIGRAILASNKMIAAAEKTGNRAKIAAAKAKAQVMLTAAKNQAVRLAQDTRRDLTNLRKLAGRNKGRKFRSTGKKTGKRVAYTGNQPPDVKKPKVGGASTPTSWHPAHSETRNKSSKFRPRRKSNPVPGTRGRTGRRKTTTGVKLSLVPKEGHVGSSGLSLVPKGSYGGGSSGLSLSPKGSY